MATTPLIIPAAERAPSIGWKSPDTKAINRSNRFPCGTSPSSTSILPSPEMPASLMTAAYTSGTWFPITTWYCPPAFTTVTIPSLFFKYSVSALLSSFREKRKRVTQCTNLMIFSLPPT